MLLLRFLVAVCIFLSVSVEVCWASTQYCRCRCCYDDNCDRLFNKTVGISQCSECSKNFCQDQFVECKLGNQYVEARCIDRNDVWNKISIVLTIGVTFGLIIIAIIKDYFPKLKEFVMLGSEGRPQKRRTAANMAQLQHLRYSTLQNK